MLWFCKSAQCLIQAERRTQRTLSDDWFSHETLSHNGIKFAKVFIVCLCVKSTRKFSKLCICSCSLELNFSSTHSIFIILGFLEVERYQGENEVDHDSQDTVQPCTYTRLNSRTIYLKRHCSQRVANYFNRQLRVFYSTWIFGSLDLSEI